MSPPRKSKLPTALPENFELTDTEKKRWKLGKIIGQGGFGLIYLASQDLDKPVAQDSNFVIKLEYHENGPLFSELKFYQRAAKLETIHRWKTTKKMDFLGIPAYWGSGLAEHDGKRYRFMVMDRLGTDLQKVCDGNGGRLRTDTVFQLGCTLLDVLEYIHENEYVHADIKASNLMLGYGDPSQVYLADYGLAYRFCPEGVHKEYKPNPKKGHNGTIEYTSLDAHDGAAPSRRGDLHVLGFCLLHWLCGTLPWDSVLKNPAQVHEAKARLMDNLPNSVQQLPMDRAVSDKMADFFLHVKELAYEQRPDYQALRTLLSAGGRRAGGGLDLSRPPGELAGASRTRGPDRSKGTGQGRGSAVIKPGRRGEQVVEGEEDEMKVNERGGGEKPRAGNMRAPPTTKPDKKQTRPRGARSNPAPEEEDDDERPRPIAACHLRGPPIGPRAQPDLGKSRTKNKRPVQEKAADDFDLTVTPGPHVNPRLPRHARPASPASPAKTTSRWDQEDSYSKRPSLPQTGRSGQTHRPWEDEDLREDFDDDEGDDQRWGNRRYRGYKQPYDDDDCDSDHGDSNHGDRETRAPQQKGSWSSRMYCAAGLVFILLAFLLALRQ